MRIVGPRQPAPHERDTALFVSRIGMIAKRLCEIETWARLAQRITGGLDDGLAKVREELDDHLLVLGMQEETIQAQAGRIAKLELMLGVAIQKREVEG